MDICFSAESEIRREAQIAGRELNHAFGAMSTGRSMESKRKADSLNLFKSSFKSKCIGLLNEERNQPLIEKAKAIASTEEAEARKPLIAEFNQAIPLAELTDWWDENQSERLKRAASVEDAQEAIREAVEKYIKTNLLYVTFDKIKQN